MSPIATPIGLVPVGKSTLAANEPAVIVPAILMFLKTETVLLVLLVTTRSGLPSPSISPMTTQVGIVPVAKSTLAANELAVIDPEVLVFLKTEMVLAVQFATARSGLPSPSMSPMAMLYGPVPVVKSTLAENEPAVIVPETLMFL